MKKILLMIAFSFLLIMPAMESLAAPATAVGDKAAQVERLLPYLSYVAEGDGNKVVYMICGAQCGRCAAAYNIISEHPTLKQRCQFRWVFVGGSDPGYYFPMEGKPGAGMKELYGNPRQIEPKTVDNPAHLKTVAGYNGGVGSAILGLFSGSPGTTTMTPWIIIKTENGFERGSAEDFMGNSTTTSFGKALPLDEGTGIPDDIMKDITEAEKLPDGQGLLADKKEIQVRLFPRDDAPLEGRPIPKGYGTDIVSKTKNGWVGIQMYEDPDMPLRYARIKDGKLVRK